MHTIKISEPVWQAIANRGKFGETEDDVLRRVFRLPASSNPTESQDAKQLATATTRQSISGPRRSRATDRMSAYLSGTQLHVSFASGPSSSWPLPLNTDKAALRTMRDKAIAFATKNAATIGQLNAVKKALTDAGYHLTK